MEKRVKKTITINENLSENIQKIATEKFGGNYSLAIESLSNIGLKKDKELQKERNLNRYVALKTLFYLRENIKANEDKLIEKLDAIFIKKHEEMKNILLEEGADYGHF